MIEKIIEFALRQRGLVLLAILAVAALGVRAYVDMPVDAFPDISPIMAPVFVEAHGLAPEEVERLVTYPIESAMAGLPGVTEIKSTSAFGMAVIYVYFTDDTNIYFARQLVNERLTSVTSELPALDEPPALGPITTGLGQIFIYYLAMEEGTDTQGKEPLTYLREINDWVVKFQLQTVPGVTEILSIGGHVLQYQIQANPRALLQYDVTMQDIVEAVQANNRNAGGQFLVLGSEESLVRGIGLLRDIEGLRTVPIRTVGGVPVTIADVAEVAYGNEIRRGVVTLDGEQEVVSGMVLKLFGENTSQVIERLYNKVASVQASLPDGVRIVPYYEQKELVEHATWTVKKALLQGGLLVLLVLFLFLGDWRGACIVGVSLPLCAFMTILLMDWTGLSANLMSLGGIAIAIGMLGDGAIVMVENIHRHLEQSQDPGGKDSPALLRATREVGKPIVYSVGIIIAVFLPLLSLEGVEGKMFIPMARTITYALLSSMLVAMLVAPALASLLLGRRHGKPPRILTPVLSLYRATLGVALRWRTALAVVTLLLLGGSLALLPRLGTEFMPALEEGSVLAGVTMAPSISLEKATETVMALERRIRAHAGVKHTVSRIGRPEAGSHPHPVNYAEIHISLVEQDASQLRKNKETLVQSIAKDLASYPGVQIRYTQPIQNAFDELLSGIKAQIAIKIFGEDLGLLEGKAEEVEAAIRDVPGVVDLSTEQNFGQPQVRIIANRAACERQGVTVEQVMELVELAIGGEVIDTLYVETRRFGIHLRLQEQYRDAPQTIRQLILRTADNRTIPLHEVAEVQEITGPIQVNRENNQRRWTVQANVRGRDLGGVIADIQARIADQVTLPPGTFLEYGGQFENQQRAMRKLGIVVPAVILIVYVLLWLAFSSMRDALIVMLNVPLALIGGIIGLYGSGEYLSVPASVGFIALFGIAVQNGVVLVSYFRQQRLEHAEQPLSAIIIESAALRLRPVLMTALTTVCGLLPLLLARGIGSEIQRPLAVVVVYGLISSTLLTLFVLPAVYSWTERPGRRAL